jgi:aminoglycoside phosphotransferase (APT) family kinase protein
MTQTPDELKSLLQAAITDIGPIESLTRLSGGASQETWRIDAGQRFILRRTPGGQPRGGSETAVPLSTEAEVITAARAAGVPAPRIHWVSPEGGPIGPGYVMEHVPGETIPRKILRDDAFAVARPRLARQCGEVLARIHTVDVTGLPHLNRNDAAQQWKQYRDIYDSYDYPHAVFELAFKWLEDRIPNAPALTLVHGDFRHGNLMIGPDGLAAVLDWELTHIGDPAEDLGWICVNSWRFGNSHNPVGGFGALDDLLEGYTAAGGQAMTAERVKYWEIFGSLKWGIMCMTMVRAFETGLDPSVERAAIGRRSSETEIDLINLIYGPGGGPA